MGSTPKYSPSSQILPSVVSALFYQQMHLSSICSFTISKLRYFGLRAPKTNSCYTTLYNDGVFDLFLNTPLLFVKFFISLPQLRGATPMLRSVLARDGAGG